VAVTFSGLAIALQAEVQLFQQLANHRVADRMTLLAQFRGEPAQALAGPTQRRLRIAPLGRLNQRQQSRQQAPVMLREWLAAAARMPHLRQRRSRTGGEFLEPTPDRARCNPGRPPHRRYATIPRGSRLRRRKHATTPFIQVGR
jgi:hypothetical protein